MLNALTPDGTFDKTGGHRLRQTIRGKNSMCTCRASRCKTRTSGGVFLWRQLEQRFTQSITVLLVKRWRPRGIVAVLADYRLYPQVRYPLFLARWRPGRGVDSKRIFHEYSGNPQRLYLMGHSSGGLQRCDARAR
jgi:hypothetical protein